MNIERLHHVSLLVTYLDRAKDFYGRVLGLREIRRPDFDFPGAWYEVGDGQVHLIVYPEKAPGPGGVDTRNAHFAFRVADFDAAVARLRSEEVEVVVRPVNKTDWPQAYCADPDGNIIEFNAAARP